MCCLDEVVRLRTEECAPSLLSVDFSHSCFSEELTNQHPGNIQFRLIASERKEEYDRCTERIEKSIISKTIVERIRSMKPQPGRFLIKNKATGRWDDVGDKEARKKTAQAIRDAKLSTTTEPRTSTAGTSPVAISVPSSSVAADQKALPDDSNCFSSLDIDMAARMNLNNSSAVEGSGHLADDEDFLFPVEPLSRRPSVVATNTTPREVFPTEETCSNMDFPTVVKRKTKNGKKRVEKPSSGNSKIVIPLKVSGNSLSISMDQHWNESEITQRMRDLKVNGDNLSSVPLDALVLEIVRRCHVMVDKKQQQQQSVANNNIGLFLAKNRMEQQRFDHSEGEGEDECKDNSQHGFSDRSSIHSKSSAGIGTFAMSLTEHSLSSSNKSIMSVSENGEHHHQSRRSLTFQQFDSFSMSPLAMSPEPGQNRRAMLFDDTTLSDPPTVPF